MIANSKALRQSHARLVPGTQEGPRGWGGESQGEEKEMKSHNRRSSWTSPDVLF